MKYTAIFFTLLFTVYHLPSLASDAAWLFAHRANNPKAIEAAMLDGVNAIEIDVMLATAIKQHKRCHTDIWCAFHKGDNQAYNLSEILMLAANSGFAAVWLE